MQRRVVLLVAAGVVVLAGAAAAIAAIGGNERAGEPAGGSRSTQPSKAATTPLEELPPPPSGIPPAPPPRAAPPRFPPPVPPPAAALPEPPGYNPVIVSPRPGMENVHPVSWRRAEVVDARRVRVHFESGVAPCSVLDRVEVTYSPTSVAIALFEGSDPAFRDATCILIAQFKAVDVTLDEPVDGRTIVDGSA